MINSLEINNFRCFKDVKQAGLKRFNFIVGGSGSGKTALLEALFLAGGSNPEIYFRLRRWRGFSEAIELTGTREAYEGLFRDLFFNFDQESGVIIRLSDSHKGKRELRIFYEGDEIFDLPLRASSTGSLDVFSVVPIVFKWEGPKRVTRSQVEIAENGGLRMKGSRDIYPMTFVSPQTLNARQNAVRYSDLSRRGRSAPVLSAMRSVYAEIEDLTLEAISGELMLHASVKGIPEKLPVVNLSGGMNKYLSMVLGIVSIPGGALIIDEIEDGFYYDNLPTLLRGVMKLCQENNSQIFASTHSYELLQAVAQVIESDEQLEKDTTLLRLEKPTSDPPRFTLVPGTSYRSAISSNFEVR